MGNYMKILRVLIIRIFNEIKRIQVDYKNELITTRNLVLNSKKKIRKLEIGPGINKIKGFETLDIINSQNVDYILDASEKLPFEDNSFDIIYASHVFEHIPWYKSKVVLNEWKRILKSSGRIEIWVPDGLKICDTFVKSEKLKTSKYLYNDGWFRFNEDKDPCVWASGRIYTYGDATGNINHPNWHHALFSKRYLIKLFADLDFKNIRVLNHKMIRGYDHGWINLGVSGQKK